MITIEFSKVTQLGSWRTASDAWHDLSRRAIREFRQEQRKGRLNEVAVVGHDDNIVFVEEFAERTAVFSWSDDVEVVVRRLRIRMEIRSKRRN